MVRMVVTKKNHGTVLLLVPCQGGREHCGQDEGGCEESRGRSREAWLVGIAALDPVSHQWCGEIAKNGGASINGGTAKGMVLKDPLKVDDSGVPPFMETPKYQGLC